MASPRKDATSRSVTICSTSGPVAQAAVTPPPAAACCLAVLVLRTQRDPADRAVLDEADPPFRRPIGEMSDIDVAARGRDGAERHRSQRAKPGENRLVERKLLARLRRHFGRHALVVGLATRQGLHVLAQ